MVFSGFGHRPDEMGGYGVDNFATMIAFAVETIPQYNPTKILSGMALGWEQALAFAAVELGIPFEAVLPFQDQESVWPDKSQNFYRDLLSKASLVRTISKGKFDSKKFYERDQWIIDHSDGIFSLWQNWETWKKGELNLDTGTMALSVQRIMHPEMFTELSVETPQKRRNTDAILSRVLDYADETDTTIVQMWPQWMEFDSDVGYEGFRESIMSQCVDEL
jgi:YspA SLOG family